MGVVYSPQEVSLGHIPQQGDHMRLARYLLGAIEESDSLLAGAVYGSTASSVGIVHDTVLMSGAEIRRDVDFFVIFKDSRFREGFQAIRDAKRRAVVAGCYARAEEHTESDVLLLRPGQVDKQYIGHFERIARQYPSMIVGEPLNYLDLAPFNPTELLFSVRQYLAAKSGKFGVASLDLSPEPRVIQRCLEAPVAITRKVMQPMQMYLGQSTPTEDKAGIHAAATVLINVASESQPEQAQIVRDSHEALKRYDKEYSELLEATVAATDARELRTYQAWLDGNGTPIAEEAFRLSRGWQRLFESPELVGEAA
jgi:hypothetical protein